MNMTILKLKSILLFSAVALGASAQRQSLDLRQWDFSRNGTEWQTVTIPHDWAISGPFDKKWDLQKVAIEQNGETQATEKSGRSGALPWIGEGYYKTTVTMTEPMGNATLVFDGAMSEPTVYVNGSNAGYWAYGYNAFRLDVTSLLHVGENLIEVRLKNVEESSRWYPGGGLYRPVQLLLTPKSHIDDWHTCVRTLSIKDGKAVVSVSARVANPDGVQKLNAVLKDDSGKTVAETWEKVQPNGIVQFVMEVENPRLWSPETPYLYTMTLGLAAEKHGATAQIFDGEALDETQTRFGIRTVSVSKEGGFQLNGVTRKLKGVCLHHDLGPLGAAINKAALIRQIKTMKEMGADAIRTAHNMPSQWQMDICDSLGMMVMAESFDMWIYPKCKNGYARFFKEWADRDVENLVLRNRNHPSIIMWSIGNEIPEQWSDEGREISRHLQDICHQLDPTRPVTQGMDRAEDALKSGFAQVMDVPGFNYRVHKYENNIRQLPKGFLLGSETASTVSSRGVYKFPVVPNDNSQFASYSPNYDPAALEKADGQCSSYDVEWCPWSNLPDDDWVWQDEKNWVIGEFVWTGYDYLGEPTPYDEYWPSRSSYFGICDLAGLPKDRYFLYRSHWNRQEHTLHMLPHWTWPGREGEVTPVYVYTDYPEAELFVNGRSQGRLKKQPSERLDRYRLRWNEVRYEPGTIEVVAYDEQGREAARTKTVTAGNPAQLVLEADRTTLKADGDDMAFITVSMADANGVFCPTADDELTFEVTGAGVFQAACNGDATSLQPFTEPQMRLFSGQLVVIVRTTKNAGDITLTVRNGKRGIERLLTLKSM
jgi:beta-galactosidase